MESVNPGTLEVPNPDWSELSPDEINQTEIHIASGKVYRVAYALRHPEHDWAFALRVTETSGECIESNDIILQAGHIKSIEPNEVVSSTTVDLPDDRWLMHYSCDLRNTDFDNCLKIATTLYDDESQRLDHS